MCFSFHGWIKGLLWFFFVLCKLNSPSLSTILWISSNQSHHETRKCFEHLNIFLLSAVRNVFVRLLFKIEEGHFPGMQPRERFCLPVLLLRHCMLHETIKYAFVLNLPPKIQIIVLVNSPGDTKTFRPINPWHWRKSPNESEMTFLISIKFHRKENNGKLAGLVHSNITPFKQV